MTKKVSGDRAADHYSWITRYGELVQRKPEFARMSLNPAIGKRWFDRYRSDVYPLDRVIVNGQEAKPPRYYDKLLEKASHLDKDALDLQRYKKRFQFSR